MENNKNKQEPNIRLHTKVGRNEKCKCGSGKKYKHCCQPKGVVFKKFENLKSNSHE